MSTDGSFFYFRRHQISQPVGVGGGGGGEYDTPGRCQSIKQSRDLGPPYTDRIDLRFEPFFLKEKRRVIE
jgi:hypothetical protein